MLNHSRNRSVEARLRARQLRKSMSVGEQWLWSCLRKNQLGFPFKRQVPVGPYILDFYCPPASLCVEVDGEQHADRQAQDARRDAFLEARGIATVRIPSLDVFEPDKQKWLQRIAAACEERVRK